MMNEFFDQFLAKSDGTTLGEHTHHVIMAGNNLIANLPFSPAEEKIWKQKLFQCAVLHDFGKIHPLFQRRLKGDRNVSIRHEIVSLWLCENYLSLTDDVLFAIATEPCMRYLTVLFEVIEQKAQEYFLRKSKQKRK